MDGSNNQLFGSYGRKKRSTVSKIFDNTTYANNSLTESSQEKLSATIRVLAEGEEITPNMPGLPADEVLQKSNKS